MMHNTEDEYYIGTMSGTSLDAIDTVIVSVKDNHAQLHHSYTHPIPTALKARLLRAATAESLALIELGALDHEFGLLLAEAVNALLAQANMPKEAIRAIGSHGQTICHQPDIAAPFSWQIGDANQIAAHTGIDTITDFRRKDIALGGQGAPLVCAFHQAHLTDAHTTVVLNIGGIANITVLRPNHAPIGFDTGAGNMLMDYYHQCQTGEQFDCDAQVARTGTLNHELLERLLDEPYLTLPPPKSTGRELFSPNWLETKLHALSLSHADIMRTLCEYSAISIANALTAYEHEQASLLLCGGGARNPLLVERLGALLPNWQLALTDARGVSSQYMEAMAFAWLAYRFVHRLTGNLPSVTGASRACILGALHVAN